MADTKWVAVARKYLGLKEYPGSATNPTILSWLAALLTPWRDDATPWCGVFVAECFREAGITPVKNFAWAQAWLNFGSRIAGPAVGAVVVFGRTGGGHVSFVIGRDKVGNLLCLGGNQGDMVKVSPFQLGRVLGYVWPSGVPVPTIGFNTLPLLNSNGQPSTNER